MIFYLLKIFFGYNTIEKFGTLYKVSMPLVIIGITFSICDLVNSIKKKKKGIDIAMITVFVTVFIILLLIIEPNINKANAIYIPMIYFIAKAICFIGDRFKIVYVLAILIYTVNFLFFMDYYFDEYTKKENYLFEQDIMDATKFAESLNKDNVYIENCLNQTYIYTLIENKLDSKDFIETVKIENNIVVGYGDYRFYYSNDIDKDGVYLLKTDNDKYWNLINNGFEQKVFGNFYVLYYENN